jgi:methylase of polypeptide subunit release factors
VAAQGSSVLVLQHDAATVADPDGPLSSSAAGCEGVRAGGLLGTVDVVLSNPPYVPDAMVPRDPEVRDHEPKLALFGGEDGLDLIRGIARTAALLLRPGGLLVIEHADVQGIDAGERGVPGLLRSQRLGDELAGILGGRPDDPCWTSVQDRIDLNSRPRFTMARRAGGTGKA